MNPFATDVAKETPLEEMNRDRKRPNRQNRKAKERRHLK